jgi:hypothetical protein
MSGSPASRDHSDAPSIATIVSSTTVVAPFAGFVLGSLNVIGTSNEPQ